jgi:hypothetical protein
MRFLPILYLDSTLFCILEWNSLSIYVIHFYFDDLKTKVNEKSANCYLVFMVLFYGSFTLVLNSNVTCIISLYNLYHVSVCLCSMSMMFRV